MKLLFDTQTAIWALIQRSQVRIATKFGLDRQRRDAVAFSRREARALFNQVGQPTLPTEAQSTGLNGIVSNTKIV